MLIQTRASKFTSAEERDEFLRKQITVTKESLEVEQSSASKLLEDISNLKNDLETEETVANVSCLLFRGFFLGSFLILDANRNLKKPRKRRKLP